MNWLWRAYPSGYDYADWGDLKYAGSDLLKHLERKEGSCYQDEDYLYETLKTPGFPYSVSRRAKSLRGKLEHARLLEIRARDSEEEKHYQWQPKRDPLQ